jgi:dihydrodipicolinate synthase/N-acetylneuraminate lyase
MYHIPIFIATATIKAEIVAELANEGTIQGIKDSTFDLSHPQKIFENLTNKSFNYLCGTELLLLEAYREKNIVKNFDAGIFSGADVLPNTYSRLFKAGVAVDKIEFSKIWPIVDTFTTMWKDGIWYLPHVCKFGMKHLGYKVNDAPCSPLEILSKKMMQNVVNTIDDTKSFWGGPDV